MTKIFERASQHMQISNMGILLKAHERYRQEMVKYIKKGCCHFHMKIRIIRIDKTAIKVGCMWIILSYVHFI